MGDGVGGSVGDLVTATDGLLLRFGEGNGVGKFRSQKIRSKRIAASAHVQECGNRFIVFYKNV